MNENEIQEISIIAGDKKYFSLVKSSSGRNRGIPIEGAVKKSIMSFISPMLNTLPNTAKNAQSMMSYEAVFSQEMKDLMKQGIGVLRKDKQGQILPHIVHTGKEASNGQIIKQVRLKSGITPANIALMGWQIASVVTAQKHLADIDKKLGSISSKLDNITAFLNEEFFADIQVELKYTNNLINSINHSNFMKDFENLHMQEIVRTYKKINSLAIRLSSLIDNKIQSFEDNKFNISDEQKLINDFKNEVDTVIGVSNIFMALIRSLYNLCYIYNLFAEDSTMSHEWRSEVEELYTELNEKSVLFNEILFEKLHTLKKKNKLHETIVVNPLRDIAKASSILDKFIAKGLDVAYINIENDNVADVLGEFSNQFHTRSTITEKFSKVPFDQKREELLVEMKNKTVLFEKSINLVHSLVDRSSNDNRHSEKISVTVNSKNEIINLLLLD